MVQIFRDIFYYPHPLGANCNVYAFKDGQHIDLIDSGVLKLGIVRQVWREMRKDGLDPYQIRKIVHPHYHFDHVQADTFFQRKAQKYGRQIDIWIPGPDRFRASPKFSMLEWNLHDLRQTFPNMDTTHLTALYRKTQGLKPLIDCPTPENIRTLNNEDLITLGKRKAKVYITGGHTEGHAFLHINDEDNILYTGDHDALNEFTCNWGNTLRSVCLAQELEPDNVFIGHNKVRLGKESAMGFINSYFAQFDDLFAKFLGKLRKGYNLNLTRLARALIGWPSKIQVLDLYAHMAIYVICKHLQALSIGELNLNEDGEMRFLIIQNLEDINLRQTLGI